MTADQKAKRRASDRERQARYRASMTHEQYLAMIKRKGDARRQRIATDPAYAAQYLADQRVRDRARRTAATGASAHA